MGAHEWKKIQEDHDREVAEINKADRELCDRTLTKYPHCKERLDYFLMRVQFHSWAEHPNITTARQGLPMLSFDEVNATLEPNSKRMTEWRKSTIKPIDPTAKWMTLDGRKVSVSVWNGTLHCCYKKGSRDAFFDCGLDGLATTNGVHGISVDSLIPVV